MLSQMYLDRAEAQVVQKYQREILDLANELRTVDAIKAVAEELVKMTNGERNQAIPSIKIIRAAFGLGLKESKDAYDQAIANHDRPLFRERVDVYSDDLPF